MKIFTVDLDSTLADTTPRRHLVAEDRSLTDWHEYGKACHLDVPHKGVAAVVRLLAENYEWAVVSGRTEQSREQTQQWLAAWCDEADVNAPLFVHLDDSDGSWDEHHGDYKARRIKALQAQGFEVVAHFDDWPEVREIVERECGVPVLCVTPTFVTSQSVQSLR